MRLLRIPEPFDHPDFIFEPKLDGFRALAIAEAPFNPTSDPWRTIWFSPRLSIAMLAEVHRFSRWKAFESLMVVALLFGILDCAAPPPVGRDQVMSPSHHNPLRPRGCPSTAAPQVAWSDSYPTDHPPSSSTNSGGSHASPLVRPVLLALAAIGGYTAGARPVQAQSEGLPFRVGETIAVYNGDANIRCRVAEIQARS